MRFHGSGFKSNYKVVVYPFPVGTNLISPHPESRMSVAFRNGVLLLRSGGNKEQWQKHVLFGVGVLTAPLASNFKGSIPHLELGFYLTPYGFWEKHNP